jgi:hypothetical protein
MNFCQIFWLAYSERWRASLGLACQLQDLIDSYSQYSCSKLLQVVTWLFEHCAMKVHGSSGGVSPYLLTSTLGGGV